MKIKASLIFTTLLLFGCAPVELEKVALNDRYYENGGLSDFVLAKEYNDLIAAEDSFAVYVYVPTCSGCNTFKPFIEAFTAKADILIYTMNGSIIDYTPLADEIKFVPAVAIISEGKVVYKVDLRGKQKKALTSEAAFETWFFDRVENL